MYSLTMLQGAWLGGAVLAVVVGLVLGVLRLWPRALRVVPAVVFCPLLRRSVTAELAQDAWTLRFADVVRCSVLGARATLTCTRRCLTRSPAFQEAEHEESDLARPTHEGAGAAALGQGRTAA
jgi:hypothetical protein